MVNRPQRAKTRNRAVYRDHFKYNVQWLMATSTHGFEDPVCFASFRTLADAEEFQEFLLEEPDGSAYGIEVVPL
jgi:hypothetical protein